MVCAVLVGSSGGQACALGTVMFDSMVGDRGMGKIAASRRVSKLGAYHALSA